MPWLVTAHTNQVTQKKKCQGKPLQRKREPKAVNWSVWLDSSKGCMIIIALQRETRKNERARERESEGKARLRPRLTLNKTVSFISVCFLPQKTLCLSLGSHPKPSERVATTSRPTRVVWIDPGVPELVIPTSLVRVTQHFVSLHDVARGGGGGGNREGGCYRWTESKTQDANSRN